MSLCPNAGGECVSFGCAAKGCYKVSREPEAVAEPKQDLGEIKTRAAMPEAVSITMTYEQRRAIEMLEVAAKYIRIHCPDREIFYDDAECDGSCVADDCEIAAEALTREA